MACAEVEDLAPELALGSLPGDQRSAVLAHLEGCSACRGLVKELSDVADALLLAAPEVDPPAGFAKRVTRPMVGERAPRRWLRWRPAAAAMVIALAVGVAIGFLPSHLESGVRVEEASFVAKSEPVNGSVYVRAGDPSWVFMTVKDTKASSSERYACDLVMANGKRVDIGTFPVDGGAGSWGRSVPMDVSQIRSVVLYDANGELVGQATMS
ncbi:MAG: anti-sigma factor family protein [Actinomycetota bacterium]